MAHVELKAGLSTVPDVEPHAAGWSQHVSARARSGGAPLPRAKTSRQREQMPCGHRLRHPCELATSRVRAGSDSHRAGDVQILGSRREVGEDACWPSGRKRWREAIARGASGRYTEWGLSGTFAAAAIDTQRFLPATIALLAAFAASSKRRRSSKEAQAV